MSSEKIEKKVVVTRVPFNELPIDEQDLLKKALDVRKNAQAPYSNYLVGVAVQSEKGTTHVGCNVERCSWTQTTHAEQNAIDSMIAALGPSKIEKLAVVAAPHDVELSLSDSPGPLKTTVCGHCLQIIWENSMGDPNVKILALEDNGMVKVAHIADLLPFRFGPEDLHLRR